MPFLIRFWETGVRWGSRGAFSKFSDAAGGLIPAVSRLSLPSSGAEGGGVTLLMHMVWS